MCSKPTSRGQPQDDEEGGKGENQHKEIPLPLRGVVVWVCSSPDLGFTISMCATDQARALPLPPVGGKSTDWCTHV